MKRRNFLGLVAMSPFLGTALAELPAAPPEEYRPGPITLTYWDTANPGGFTRLTYCPLLDGYCLSEFLDSPMVEVDGRKEDISRALNAERVHWALNPPPQGPMVTWSFEVFDFGTVI